MLVLFFFGTEQEDLLKLKKNKKLGLALTRYVQPTQIFDICRSGRFFMLKKL
jgi:hypothetical protein